MSSSDLAISVEGLHKEYTIAHQRVQHSTLAETALARLRRPFQREHKETFHALTDLSFEINKGDVVGIIGRNGAGKSTLLKVLSQITEPTAGKIDLYGRVGSLLEVGTGFHPELTGRENIFLNGAILGMRRKEIERQFDAIVDFSDVEQFLDTPVKRYSSGMYVRLAFAVAAHLQPEILIVDEVLAVGDAEFQKKCLGKMKDVANSGRTVLFVSHHMQSVAVLCQKAMYLERGRLKFLGSVAGAVEHYANSFTAGALEEVAPDRRAGTGELRFTSVTTDREFYECAGEKRVHFTVERRKAFTGSFFIACELQDQHGFTIAHCDSRMVGYWVKVTDRSSGSFSIRTPWLKPGTYRLNMYLCSAGILDHYEGAAQLTIIPLLPYPATDNEEATSKGMIFADFGFRDEEEPALVAEPLAEETAALPV